MSTEEKPAYLLQFEYNNCTNALTHLFLLVGSGPVVGTAGPTEQITIIVVLCKSCSVLLCVLEQPRVDSSDAGPNLGAFGPIGIRPAQCMISYHHKFWVIHIASLLKTSWSWSYGSLIYNYFWNQCLSPLTVWVRIPLRQAKCTRDKVCLWLRWFSPDSSTNKTDRHDRTEILLKVTLSTNSLDPFCIIKISRKKPN